MRPHNWQSLLSEAIEAARAKPFEYGRFDCMLFCADTLQAITGIDYAAPVRGYSTFEEAAQIIARYGGKEQLITALLGSDSLHISRARRGDVVLATLKTVDDGVSDCAGICLGHLSVFPKDVGLQMQSTLAARLAWRVD